MKQRPLKSYIKALLDINIALGTFIMVQVLITAVPVSKSLQLLFSSLISSSFICYIGISHFPADFLPRRCRFKGFYLALIGFAVGIVAINSLVSQIMPLDNSLERIRLLIATPLGCLGVGLIAPIAEEIVFRSGIIGTMLRHRVGSTSAIIISSVIFGIVHFNPAQSMFAVCMGIMLGIIYVRSRSVLPCIICHVVNNSVSLVALRLSDGIFSQPDVSPVALYTATFILIFLSFFIFHLYLKK